MKKFNCCPKHKSDFTIPTRNELLPLMDGLAIKIVDTIVPFEEMVTTLANYVGTMFRVNVLQAENEQINAGSMEISALYDQDIDESGKIPIELILLTNPMDHTYLWSKADFKYISTLIVDSLIHEMVHMHQARKRHFLEVGPHIRDYTSAKLEAQDYLGQYDEIDAYAHNIASELAASNAIGDISEFLSQPSIIPLQMSINLWAYTNTFDQDITHPVIKRLLKKVYKHYQNLK